MLSSPSCKIMTEPWTAPLMGSFPASKSLKRVWICVRQRSSTRFSSKSNSNFYKCSNKSNRATRITQELINSSETRTWWRWKASTPSMATPLLWERSSESKSSRSQVKSQIDLTKRPDRLGSHYQLLKTKSSSHHSIVSFRMEMERGCIVNL